jgi:hypothetical protein
MVRMEDVPVFIYAMPVVVVAVALLVFWSANALAGPVARHR